MNRRDFLQALGAGAMLWGSGIGSARAASDRVLVLVFMRGGWDGLNVTVPYGEDAYYALRPTIAVRTPSEGGAAAALDLDGFFGFHPSLQALWRLYREGWVAAMPAVHYSESSRSHFEGQDIIESGAAPAGIIGWLTRYLSATGGASAERAIAFGAQPPRSLGGGGEPALAFPDLSNLALATGGQDRQMLATVLAQAAEWPVRSNKSNAPFLRAAARQVVSEREKLVQIGQMAPDSAATYPASAFGQQLRQAAALVKGRAGLEVITLDCGGWDTHSNQGADTTGRMGSKLADFSAAVEAFFIDLGSSASRVTLLTATEFGRTAAENGSKGTDHGNASTWLAIGPNVRGGIHLGSGWPGLTATQLVDGRALAHSVDFRSVYANVLTKFLGAGSTSGILPAFPPDGLDIFG